MFFTVSDVHTNPNKTIICKNIKPDSWSGRKFNMGIYKNQRLLVTQEDVHVGDQADFMLKPKIIFAVVNNMHVGEVFTSLNIITSSHTEIDLSDYPNGIVVTLNESPSGGEYVFTSCQMPVPLQNQL
jgi:dynein heavy chain 1